MRTIDVAELLDAINSPIILKIDIEGEEYSILPHLAAKGKLAKVKRLFCEWHAGRIAVTHTQHLQLVEQLNKYGMQLTGSNKWDEFIICVESWKSKGRLLTEFSRHVRLFRQRLKQFFRP